MNGDIHQIVERLAGELVYWCAKCGEDTPHVRRQWLGVRFEWCAVCGRKEYGAVSGTKCPAQKTGRLTRF